MENLPASVLLEIYLLLNKPNLRGCRQVSQSWNEIISNSRSLNSGIVYVVDKSFNSIEPLLYTKTGWPALRFSGCFKMGHMMSYIPATIFSALTTLHAKECVINRKCLTQIFAITSLIDLHLNHCHLQNSIFQETTPDEPLEIYSKNIRSLTILMSDRDITYLAQHLFPHLKSLVSFKIKEICSYGILQKLKPYQIKDDFYEFPGSELNQLQLPENNGDNSDDSVDDYESEPEPTLESEFQQFLFSLNPLHQLVNLAQIHPFPEIFPLQIIQQNIDVGVQIVQPAGPFMLANQVQEEQQHELEALVQDDFIENVGNMNAPPVEVFEALIDLQEEAMEDQMEDAVEQLDAEGQMENGENVELEDPNEQVEEFQDGNGQAQEIQDGNEQFEEIQDENEEFQEIQDGNGQIYAVEGSFPNDELAETQANGQHQEIVDGNDNGDAQGDAKIEDDQIEVNEAENIQIGGNDPTIIQDETNVTNDGLTEEMDAVESTEVNSQVIELVTVHLDPTIQKLIELIKSNAKTLEKIHFSFRRSMHPWNIQLFTHVVQTFFENELQLKSLALNAFNIPMRNIFTSETSNTPLPDSFAETVAFNLKQFLGSQTRLSKLTLGLRQLLPTIQLNILKEVPESVEILTIWPVEDQTHDNLLGRFPNLKKLRIPQDSTQMFIPPAEVIAMMAGGPMPIVRSQSLANNLVKESGELPNLKSFRGQFFIADNVLQDFCTVAINLTELRLRCYHLSDSDLQVIIQNLRELKHLELISVLTTDAGLTGFDRSEIEEVQQSDNYPHILAHRHFVAPGLPLSNLTHLEEIKFRGYISDFGIYYGLNGLQLMILDLDARHMQRDITDFGLNVLARQAIDLEIVQLHLGFNVTEEGMKNFVSSLKSLDHRSSKITHVSRAHVFNFRKAKDIIRAHGQVFEEEEE